MDPTCAAVSLETAAIFSQAHLGGVFSPDSEKTRYMCNLL